MVADPGSHEEDTGVEEVDRAEGVAEGEELVAHLGIHGRAHHVHVLKARAVLLRQLRLQGVQVERRQRLARPPLDTHRVLQDLLKPHLAAQGLRKSSVRLADVTLHELHHRAGKAELFCLVQDVLARQFVLDHELGQVSHHLGRRNKHILWVRYLDDVAKEQVGIPIGLLDALKLFAKPQAEGLELEVGVLPTGNLVLVDVGVAALHCHGALERGVQRPCLFPVRRARINTPHSNATIKKERGVKDLTCFVLGALQASHDGPHARLRRHA
ncbi:unnamed protein product [Ixodes persulcatus]